MKDKKIKNFKTIRDMDVLQVYIKDATMDDTKDLIQKISEATGLKYSEIVKTVLVQVTRNGMLKDMYKASLCQSYPTQKTNNSIDKKINPAT